MKNVWFLLCRFGKSWKFAETKFVVLMFFNGSWTFKIKRSCLVCLELKPELETKFLNAEPELKLLICFACNFLTLYKCLKTWRNSLKFKISTTFEIIFNCPCLGEKASRNLQINLFKFIIKYPSRVIFTELSPCSYQTLNPFALKVHSFLCLFSTFNSNDILPPSTLTTRGGVDNFIQGEAKKKKKELQGKSHAREKSVREIKYLTSAKKPLSCCFSSFPHFE